MISFRNYVVTLVAVFVALAAGVALGGGPLSELGRPTDTAPASADTGAADRFGDAFARSVAQRVYGEGLKDHPVAVLVMPGVDPATVTALERQVTRAGGRVTATYPLGGQLVDGGQKSLVDTLGSQLMTQLGGGVSQSASTYPRIGQLLGVAVATRESGGGKAGDAAGAVRQSLEAAHLLDVPAGDPGTAPLVLVVTHDELDPAILGGLAQGLAAKARGVVVAGPTGAKDLAALASAGVTSQVSVVDGVERSAGQVATTAALVAAYGKPGGSFGASGSDGAVPLG